jgi:hypothetical protein
MYLGTYDLLAVSIALVSSIVVLTLALRQNMELQRDNTNLRRKLNMERMARELHGIRD